MDSSESELQEAEKSHNKFKRKYDALALDNKQELPETTLKKRKNAEKCKRYRERKKAQALQFSALNNEQEEPSEISMNPMFIQQNESYLAQIPQHEKDDIINDTPIHQQQSTFTPQIEPSFVQVQPSAASIRHIKLHQENTENFKEDIISGGELYAEHINNFQDIIANRFLNFRPVDVHLIALPQFVRPISHLQKHIQIISGVSRQVYQITHWICTYYDGNVINIYDSLNMESLYPEMEIFLNQLFPHKPQHKFHRVKQQPNNTDCGVYAIAFATSLLNNRDPSKENYDHPKMRSNLLDIYNTTELLPFPIEPSADALRKRRVNKVTFQHKEHSAAALYMRKVRARKKLEAHRPLKRKQIKYNKDLEESNNDLLHPSPTDYIDIDEGKLKNEENPTDRDRSGEEGILVPKFNLKEYLINQEELQKETEIIWNTTTNEADKKLTIEMRNWLGSIRKEVPQDFHDSLLLKGLEKWQVWLSRSSCREDPLCYKCYICDKAWWRLMPFCDHMKQHKAKNINIDIEESFHECYLILFPSNEKCEFRDIFIASKCWKCGKDFEAHKINERYFNRKRHVCIYCGSEFYTCKSLLQHEVYCLKYIEVLKKSNTFDLEKTMQANFQCTICYTHFWKEQHLNEHMLLRHTVRSDVPVTVTIRKCKLCNGNYFVWHLHDCPKKRIKKLCNYCCRKFSSKFSLSLHTIMNKECVHCCICKKYIGRKCMEMEHLVQHSDAYMFVYKCFLCQSHTVILGDQHKHSLKKHIHAHVKKRCRNCEPYYEKMLIPKRYILEMSQNIIKNEHRDEIAGQSPSIERRQDDLLLNKIKIENENSSDIIIEDEGIQKVEDQTNTQDIIKEDEGVQKVEDQTNTQDIIIEDEGVQKVEHQINIQNAFDTKQYYDVEIKTEYEEYEDILFKEFETSKNATAIKQEGTGEKIKIEKGLPYEEEL